MVTVDTCVNVGFSDVRLREIHLIRRETHISTAFVYEPVKQLFYFEGNTVIVFFYRETLMQSVVYAMETLFCPSVCHVSSSLMAILKQVTHHDRTKQRGSETKTYTNKGSGRGLR